MRRAPHDPDQWAQLGVHWHAYITDHSDTTRVHRLDHTPEVVLRSPGEVADWLATQTRAHALRTPVRLIAERDKPWVTVADEEQLAQSHIADKLTAERGDSIYVDVRHEHGRLYLWCEAVTPDQCDEHAKEVTPA